MTEIESGVVIAFALLLLATFGFLLVVLLFCLFDLGAWIWKKLTDEEPHA